MGGRWLARLTRAAVSRPWTVWLSALGLAVLSMAWAVSHLDLKTSNLDLIDPDLPEVARFEDFAASFGTPNVMVVVLEGGTVENSRRAVARLAPRLRHLPGVRSVVDRLPQPSPAISRFAPSTDVYLTSEDGRLFFLFVQPADARSRASTLEPFVLAVRRCLDTAALEDLGIVAGLTGLPQYALEDRQTIEEDIGRLSGLAFGLILGVFLVAFGSLRRPLMAMLTLLVTLALLSGLIAIYPGHLTLLSAFFASILFGLGVDYGIHLLIRAEELMTEGLRVRKEISSQHRGDEVVQSPPNAGAILARTLGEGEALCLAVEELGSSLLTSALTTASVLLAMVWSGFLGFAELGIIAAVGILGSLLAMVTLLPAGLVLWSRWRPSPRIEVKAGRWRPRPPPAIVSWIFLAAAVGLAVLPSPPFNGDYLDLQPKASEAVRLERLMVQRSSWSPQFAVFLVQSAKQADRLAARLAAEDSVGKVRSAGEILRLLPWLEGEAAEQLRASFVDADGRLAVYAYPKNDIWAADSGELFVRRMQALDPEVTGMPFLGRWMMQRSQRALRIAAFSGLLLLGFWVWLDFRHWRWALLAMLPALLTLAGLGALLDLFGLAFNPLNVMALPLVLGIAVDDGVHMVHRFLAEDGNLDRTLAGTGRSISLTSLTTLAAFTSLGLAAHRGLASFAITLSLGVALAWLLSLSVLPALLRRSTSGRS